MNQFSPNGTLRGRSESQTRMHIRPSKARLSVVVADGPVNASDRDLAAGLVAGEDWAVSETWRRFAPMVLMTAERVLGSRTDAEDLAQEVFWLLFRRAKTLRQFESFRSFVYSFVVRLLGSELRRRKRRRWLSFFGPAPPEMPDHRSADVESRELLRRFSALLDRLAPRDRLVFVLRSMDKMTIEEIAETMNLSSSTVKRAMAHASGRLSRWIATDPGLAALVGGNPWGR
jgi:RNA polymerase sigma-70 factor (ECF subfamily)